MSIEKTLVCSTAHVTESDARILENWVSEGTSLPEIISTNYGWIAKTYLYTSKDDMRDDDQARLSEGLSEAFNAVLDYARSHECTLVHFDQDELQLEDLEVFEW